MADVPQVTIVNGLPTGGSGTVETNSQVIAAVAALGVKLDTAITALQIIDNMVLAAGSANVGKIVVTDGTDDVAVTAASTAAAAADKALVVAISPNGQNANGQATMANSAPVAIASDQSNVPVVITATQTASYSAVGTFTPAATSHAAGDCNGAAATFTTMGPSAGRVMITGVRLMIYTATVKATAWRLYLYNVTPASAYADDAAHDLLTGDRSAYLGYVDLGTAVDLGGTQYVQTTGVNLPVKLSGTSLFGYLVNTTTTTMEAVSHDVTLHTTAI